ncbi:hypothetical protein, partial [Sinorhizobium meliloti]|uniref:hypothetical protein n=2 Tax=Sinorhizobium TaxID=28105 RepID=UPI001AEFF30D
AQSRQSASANLGNPRAKDIVASSAAALVSDRAYRPPPSDTSTTIFKKSAENRKSLFLKVVFHDARKVVRRFYQYGSALRAFGASGDASYMVNAVPPFKGRA